MVMRTGTAVGLTLFSLLAVRSSQACSCAGPGPVCAAYWTTPVLFLGHVVGIEHVYPKPPEEKAAGGLALIGPGQNLVHFEITKSYRGALEKEVVIHTSDQGSACGFPFEQGHEYLVYAHPGSNDELNTTHCTGTHEVLSPAEDPDLHWLDALPAAAPGASIFGRIQTQRPNADGGYDSSGLVDIAVSIAGVHSRTAVTNEDGVFRADGLAPGKYAVSAVAPKGYSPLPGSTVTLRDHGCAEVAWSTRLDGHIGGHVYFVDGTPAAGLYLTAKLADASPREPWAAQTTYASTAADGGFDFAALEPGSYVLAANMDFAPAEGKPYYRRAFFPSAANRAGATILSVGPGQKVDNLRFNLPPDSQPATISQHVQVLGFDGQPAPHAQVIAYDDIWENSVTPEMADGDEHGNAIITLRPGSHYDIEALVNLPDSSQACAEPLGVDAHDEPAPIVLRLSRHIGNCMTFKKPRTP